MMFLKQVKGPFESGNIISIEDKKGYWCTHVGIQYPFGDAVYSSSIDSIVLITYKDKLGRSYASKFRVDKEGILEFDETEMYSISLAFQVDLPPETIVDFIFTNQQEKKENK